MTTPTAKLSVLDLCPILQGGSAALSLRNSLDLARHAERLGFRRYWLAEHHNVPAVASAATAVVVGQVAAATSSIRVGAGGVMLPNHAPLVIAEQFGTLEALYPKRIDLGVGRAPGGEPAIARALRRGSDGVAEFPQDVIELIDYLRPARPGQAVRAIPGEGASVPVWILGTSSYGARLAASMGLPYAFGSHFGPADMHQAIVAYREHFRPSEFLAKPYLMLSITVIAADTDAQARFLATTMEQIVVNMRTGRLGPVPPPLANFAAGLEPMLQTMARRQVSSAIVGGPLTVTRELAEFADRTGADEIMVTDQIYDHGARVRSYEIIASARDEIVSDLQMPTATRDVL